MFKGWIHRLPPVLKGWLDSRVSTTHLRGGRTNSTHSNKKCGLTNLQKGGLTASRPSPKGGLTSLHPSQRGDTATFGFARFVL